jgi:LPS-assembly lipoprotein
MKRRIFLLTAPVLLLAGCGFELRRLGSVPFSSIYIDAAAGSGMAAKLRKALVEGGTRVVDDPAQAEVTLKLGNETHKRTILALSGAGQVSEYRLNFQITYSVSSKAGQTLAEPSTIELFRDFSYNPSALLGKGAEENKLALDMEDHAMQQIVRRLRSLKAS